MNDLRPTQFSIRGILITTAIAAVVVGLIIWQIRIAKWRQAELDEAISQIGDLEGAFTQGSVDGTYYVWLHHSELDDVKLRCLAEHFANFPGPSGERVCDFSLNFHGTKITDEGLKTLGGLNVSILHIGDTAVSDKSLNTLCNFQLAYLDVRGTEITQEGLAKLEAAHPDAEIRR